MDKIAHYIGLTKYFYTSFGLWTVLYLLFIEFPLCVLYVGFMSFPHPRLNRKQSFPFLATISWLTFPC